MMHDSTNAEQRVPPPHTQVHHLLRRVLENAQDVVIIGLMVVLLGIAISAVMTLFRTAVLRTASPSVVLSQILYILILTELYRTLIFYLREHRVSVALVMETTIVTTVNQLTLTGRESAPLMVLAIGGLLLVLGSLLALDRWTSGIRNDVSHTSAH
ncbi:MAG TPA: phosphate-starvation-inducible PsiE family protein [Vicinamibacterales bacterium]|nr:phosphate-starvation-inducible PsiE family protein [Vicinamibacterales bacterium]